MRTIIIRADAVLVWFLMQAASIPILAFCEPKGHVNWIVISFWVRILAIFEGGGEGIAGTHELDPKSEPRRWWRRTLTVSSGPERLCRQSILPFSSDAAGHCHANGVIELSAG